MRNTTIFVKERALVGVRQAASPPRADPLKAEKNEERQRKKQGPEQMKNVAGFFLIGGSALVFVVLLLMSDGGSSAQAAISNRQSAITGENAVADTVISRPEPIPSYDRVKETDTATKMIAIEKQTGVEGIGKFLKDSSPEVRAKAALKLWGCGTPDAMAKLKSLEGDTDEKVRTFVRSALSTNIVRSGK